MTGTRRIKCDQCENWRYFPQHFYTYNGRMTARSVAPDGTVTCKFCARGGDEDAELEQYARSPNDRAFKYLEGEIKSKRMQLTASQHQVVETQTRCSILETAVAATLSCNECGGKGVFMDGTKVFECSCRRMLREVVMRHFPHILGANANGTKA